MPKWFIFWLWGFYVFRPINVILYARALTKPVIPLDRVEGKVWAARMLKTIWDQMSPLEREYIERQDAAPEDIQKILTTTS